MKTDPQTPQKLKETQEWFASIITQPIDIESRMHPITPTGNPIEEEAKQYILPSLTLLPHQRMQIYNQQYWWRLLSTLHECFPLVVRLFGYTDFNESIATPYLMKYQSNHWSLNTLGDRLPKWVEEEYHEADRQFILDAAHIDAAYESAFYAAHRKLNAQEANIEELLTKKLTLQPHIHLFEFDYHLFQFRDLMIDQKPEHWEENPFPEMAKEKPYHFILSRNKQSHLVWNEIDPIEYQLLKTFIAGNTLENLIEWIEKQPDPYQQIAGEKLHYWIQSWILHEWLTDEQID